MKSINEFVQPLELTPRILQFGTGNFLRAFFDYMVDVYNLECDGDLGIVAVKNTEGSIESFREQNNLYTVITRGIENNSRVNEDRIVRSINEVISCYDDYEQYMEYAKSITLRFIVSNTTEVGIRCSTLDDINATPPTSFPAKLTKFLYERYLFFEGDIAKGLIIIPTELIVDNGSSLYNCIVETIKKWKLSERFLDWIDRSCVFCSTLVDKIVSGYPPDSEQLFYKLGYSDKLITACEVYSLFVIESDTDISDELPLDKANFDVIFTNDASGYRDRKLFLLNGAHTASVTAAYLSGLNSVLEMIQHKTFSSYIHRLLFKDIIPVVGLDNSELTHFANSVVERFNNPYINHSLENISTFSISKFKTRLLPIIKIYSQKNEYIPETLVFSLACILLFYRSNSLTELVSKRENSLPYYPVESEEITDIILRYSHDKNYNYIESMLSDKRIWNENLTKIKSLLLRILIVFENINRNGVLLTMEVMLDNLKLQD